MTVLQRGDVGVTMGAHHQDERSRQGQPHGAVDQQRCQNLLDGLDHTVIWETDAETLRTTFVSGTTAKVLGIPAEQWFTEANFWASRLHPDERATILDRMRQAAAQGTGAECRFDHRFRLADGRYLWMHTGLQVIQRRGEEPGLAFFGVSVGITEQKETELRFRQLASHVAEVFWLATADLRQMLYVSPTYETVYHRSCQSLYEDPDSVLQAVHPDDRARLAEARKLAAVNGYDVQYRLLWPDGTIRWVHGRASPIADESGQVYRVAGVAADITSYKQVEQALRASEARLAGVVDSAMDAIISIDQARRIVLFNAAAERTFGYQAADVIGQPIDHLIPVSYRGQHADEIYRFGETGMTSRSMGHPGRVMALRRNGEVFPIEATISQAAIGGEKLYTIILRDVTERRQAEEQRSRLIAELQQAVDDRQRSLAQLNAVFENASVGIALFDRAHRYKGINTTMATINGLTREDHLEHPISEIVPHDAPRAGPLIDRVFATGQAIHNLEFASDPALTERQRHWLVNFYPVPAPDGTVWLVGAVVVDITDRKEAEENLRRNERRLRAAEAEARRAARDREELLSIVSHDLKNPLTAILMNTEVMLRLLPDHGTTDRLRRQSESIRQAALRMNQLVIDLLDLSRMQAGQLAIAPEPQAIDALVNEAIGQQEALAAASGIRLQWDLPDDLPPVMADRPRMQQVFSNLIGNAIKFNRPGGSVTLSAERHKGHVVVAVRDTGPGIADDQIPLLFERFWQAEVSSQRGTGLGLAITKGIVRAHGGAIWVQSTVGSGSTFFFSLPVAGETRRPSVA